MFWWLTPLEPQPSILPRGAKGLGGELLPDVGDVLQVRCVTTLPLPVLSSGTLLPLQRNVPKGNSLTSASSCVLGARVKAETSTPAVTLPLTSAQGAG